MGPLGMGEILFLLLLGLLLFGPRKLPELGRMVGRGMAEFRRASNDLRATVEDEIHTYENTVNAQSKPAKPETLPKPAPDPAPSIEPPDGPPDGPATDT